MPLYEYECTLCGEFTLQRPISQRNDPAECGDCGLAGTRVISAPSLAIMNPTVRKAVAVNERSQHEPRVSTGTTNPMGHRCASRCGCGSSGRRKVPGKAKVDEQGRPRRFKSQKKANSRPWMIGH